MKKIMRLTGIISFLIIVIVLVSPTALADLNPQFIDDQDTDDEPGLRFGYHSETGKMTFLGANPASPIVVPRALSKGLMPQERALSILEQFGQFFGINDAARELRVLKSEANQFGRNTTRYQQMYEGIPVIAGEMMVNMDERGALISINGEISPGLELDPVPQISADDAGQIARAAASKWYGLGGDQLDVSKPELWIYDPRLISPSTHPPTLVWRMDVSGVELLEVNELVLVDAMSGGIRLHFNQIDTARNRMTYDANNGTSLPGTLRCNETNPTCSGGDAHEVAAHIYAGDTYNFYWNYHGRDSINDEGMTLISTVHYKSGFQNAFWNGSQMVYGDAFGYPLADDVVAHELTHGVTDYESNLFYYYESGAINESLSDIWGEFVDQDNGEGDDSPAVKWLMGEDISGLGALRDMADPTTFEDPDRMTSKYYYKLSGDNGGVHTNSGVNNKAAFLMTDGTGGGEFNEYVVDGLGIPKVAAIYYEVQTNYLTSGSGYSDLYNFLYQACVNLIGGPEGITSGDCDEVLDAVNAVEMNLEPSFGYNPDAVTCPGGDFPSLHFIDKIESGTGNWSFGSLVGPNNWQLYTGFSSSGDNMLWGSDEDVVNDTYAELTVDVLIPAGTETYLHFRHSFGFEDPNYDGGLIDYSINGGSDWNDAGSLFDGGQDYQGTIRSSWENPNGGEEAFIGDSHGYVSSRYDLSSLAGEEVRFRWRVSTDVSISDLGWVIDDVRIYLCGEGILLPIVVD